jgi:hypothetical protein
VLRRCDDNTRLGDSRVTRNIHEVERAIDGTGLEGGRDWSRLMEARSMVAKPMVAGQSGKVLSNDDMHHAEHMRLPQRPSLAARRPRLFPTFTTTERDGQQPFVWSKQPLE